MRSTIWPARRRGRSKSTSHPDLDRHASCESVRQCDAENVGAHSHRPVRRAATAELERLDWADVHFADNLIEVTAAKTKTARRRLVKIQPNLREWLAPVRKLSGRVTPTNFPAALKRCANARASAGLGRATHCDTVSPLITSPISKTPPPSHWI